MFEAVSQRRSKAEEKQLSFASALGGFAYTKLFYFVHNNILCRHIGFFDDNILDLGSLLGI